MNIQETTERISKESALLTQLRAEIGRIIVGQDNLIMRLIQAMICDGHVLIEGLPGLAKTLTITALAQTVSAKFQRIQFTPDLLPADVIGTLIYNPKTGEFTTKKGPIFTNIVLADEINRAPAKVQSALLEAMQEREVTIGENTFQLEKPFFVLATQNPVEQEGTYPLPEAQVDRFLFKLLVTYPTKADEKTILRRMSSMAAKPVLNAVMTPADIERLRNICDDVFVDERIEDYIIDLVDATRHPDAYGLQKLQPMLRYGASPRATIFLTRAARVQAMMDSRAYVTPQDVKSVAYDVLRHRIFPTYEAEAEELTPDLILQDILNTVKVP